MAHDTILFAPKCLVLISRHDFPETFRNVLGVIYTVYSESMVGAGGEKIKLETLVGNLLGHIYVPRSGGSQVRFTLGKNPQKNSLNHTCDYRKHSDEIYILELHKSYRFIKMYMYRIQY